MRFRKDQAPTGPEVRRMLRDQGFRSANLSYTMAKDGTVLEYRTVISTAKKANAERLVEQLRATERVIGFSISPTGD